MFTPPRFWCGRGEEPLRRVTWIELFFDLVFVAAVAQLGTRFAAGVTPAAVVHYAAFFLLVWWAWNGYAVHATRFHADDAFDWALTLLQMFAVTFMAANAEGTLDGDSTAGFVAAFAVMRILLVIQYLRAAAIAPARRLALECAAGIGLAAAIWLASAMVPMPARAWLWAAAAIVEAATAIGTGRHTATLPPDAEHLPERVGLFTLIFFGESMIAVMKGIQGQPTWSLSAASAAFLGLGAIFAAWAWYFGPARAAAARHVRTRADVRAFQAWHYVHLPLYVGLALFGAVVEHVIVHGGVAAIHGPEALALAAASAATLGALVALTRLATAEVSAAGHSDPAIARGEQPDAAWESLRRGQSAPSA
jgi:low temperature requirement protein LtrA